FVLYGIFVYSTFAHFFALNFLFQAEDGIRGRNVTGVQTCALPISGEGRGLVGDLVRRHDPYDTGRGSYGSGLVHPRFGIWGNFGLLSLRTPTQRCGGGSADVAQLVERNLAKVEVAGSNPVIRSGGSPPSWWSGREARQRPAKPSTRVQIPSPPRPCRALHDIGRLAQR